MSPNFTYKVTDSRTAGTILRALREARGLTQEELGRLLGISKARVSAIERDPSGVALAQVLSIVALLGARFVLEERPLRVAEPTGGEW